MCPAQCFGGTFGISVAELPWRTCGKAGWDQREYIITDYSWLCQRPQQIFKHRALRLGEFSSEETSCCLRRAEFHMGNSTSDVLPKAEDDSFKVEFMFVEDPTVTMFSVYNSA